VNKRRSALLLARVNFSSLNLLTYYLVTLVYVGKKLACCTFCRLLVLIQAKPSVLYLNPHAGKTFNASKRVGKVTHKNSSALSSIISFILKEHISFIDSNCFLEISFFFFN